MCILDCIKIQLTLHMEELVKPHLPGCLEQLDAHSGQTCGACAVPAKTFA